MRTRAAHLGLVDRFRDANATSAIDVVALAADLGVRVVEAALPLGTLGATIGDRKVLIASGMPPTVQRFALAHELGHVLVRRDCFPWAARATEEMCCDWWAIDLLVPPASVTSLRDVKRAALSFGVEPVVVAAQVLRSVDGSPSTARLGHDVACRLCGVRPHVPRCVCGQQQADWRRRMWAHGCRRERMVS